MVLDTTAQKINISGNILTLAKQDLQINLVEQGPTYSANIAGNIFNGTGTNSLYLTDSFVPGPAPAPNTAVINLAAGTFIFDGQSNQLNNFANVVVSPDIQVSLTGSNADNILSGSDSADYLAGLGGNDTLLGNGGNDILFGGTGNDNIDGGAGTDVAYFTGRETQYTITGTPLPGRPAAGQWRSRRQRHPDQCRAYQVPVADPCQRCGQ